MFQKKHKILLVEDEKIFREALFAKLHQAGFDVHVAVNGKEGLKQAQENTYDLIILDLVMPEMDGLTMLKKIREDEKIDAVPVFILTNLCDTKSIVEGMERGVSYEEGKKIKEQSFSQVDNENLSIYCNSRFDKGTTKFLVKDNVLMKNLVKMVEKKMAVSKV